jgi:hypothetical protein
MMMPPYADDRCAPLMRKVYRIPQSGAMLQMHFCETAKMQLGMVDQIGL